MFVLKIVRRLKNEDSEIYRIAMFWGSTSSTSSHRVDGVAFLSQALRILVLCHLSYKNCSLGDNQAPIASTSSQHACISHSLQLEIHSSPPFSCSL